jgi:zinc finger domain, LSD1 subclass subfamily
MAEQNDKLQFQCPSCGGQMQYSPEAGNLKCLYCEAELEIPHIDGAIVENDYDEWVERETRAPFFTKGAQTAPAATDDVQSGEATNVLEVTCKQCGATTTFDPHIQAQRCPFCDTPLENNEAHLAQFWEPNYVIPFQFSQKACSEVFKKWMKGKWFAPNAARRTEINNNRFKGTYLPYWTYDAQMTAEYTGQRGEDETDYDSDGNSHTTTRWYSVAGTVAYFFDDVLVPAVESIDRKILTEVRDWKVEEYKTYNPAYFAGFVTQIYTVDFIKGFEYAQGLIQEKTEELVKEDIGGDRQRIDTLDITLDDKKFKLLVLPFWIASYRYKEKIYQVVINGRTGKVYGKSPISALKVILTILIAIAIYFAADYLFDLLSE